ncbi:hypothetical protein B0T26DRAFT_729372 [Lasiosphaeria miniovina]|uniref:Nucleoside phosphorylase domain-containing protein n=1 Tax=Lasiosphaeria miniovina TaxID=1954250 RepID=A0AA39ZSN8_9PEZI|nr:uncharacterized protein B0T26DRAFT_729372 [Lasiosphaeria miniovina]KAK0702946.1 hypothetical protein B0T26DRAFT_729372 [Lasiosphaeria miniovina]
MSAVRYMLDKEHARLPRKLGDSTLYVLGELSGHNVVLASLPGSQGKGAAVAVAKDMARTFPSIELRLMVGIGGGVPSGKNDIHLGDVVMSVPDGEHGGVVQYDLGRNTDDGFVMKGFLWPPPEILRSAVGIMRSDHRVSQNKIPEFLSAMFQKSDDLRVSYQRPVEPDELFQFIMGLLRLETKSCGAPRTRPKWIGGLLAMSCVSRWRRRAWRPSTRASPSGASRITQTHTRTTPSSIMLRLRLRGALRSSFRIMDSTRLWAMVQLRNTSSAARAFKTRGLAMSP